MEKYFLYLLVICIVVVLALINYIVRVLVNKLGLESITSYIAGCFTKHDNIDASNSPEIIENQIRMLFFGDMMLDRRVATVIEANGLDYVFGQLDEVGFYDNYDLISANLESAITNKGKHYLPLKKYDFAISPEIVAGTKNYNFNFFNLANNHFGDQGIQGINETRVNLDKLDFNYIGCENGMVSDCSSKIIEIKNSKIGMVGLSVIGNKFDLKKAKEIIIDLKSKTNLVIVNIHWGNEYKIQFNNTQQKMAYDFIDIGADVIIGHHPHVAQGVEIHKNKLVFYSLGNFVFDQYFSKETQKGLAVEFIFRENESNFKLHPFKSKKSQVNLMRGTERDNFLQELVRRSVLDERFIIQMEKGIFRINN